MTDKFLLLEESGVHVVLCHYSHYLVVVSKNRHAWQILFVPHETAVSCTCGYALETWSLVLKEATLFLLKSLKFLPILMIAVAQLKSASDTLLLADVVLFLLCFPLCFVSIEMQPKVFTSD